MATQNHPTNEAHIEAVFEVQSLLRSMVAGLDRRDSDQARLDAQRLTCIALERLDNLAESLEQPA